MTSPEVFENAAVKHNVEYGCFSLSAILLVIRETNRKNVCKKKYVSIIIVKFVMRIASI